MRVLSLFSGIGAFEKALDVLKIPYELVGYCEIDKYASKSYSAIHDVPEAKNFGDITKIDEKALPRDIDLITYGFPCQDISLAGKQKGLFNEDGTQTRSGLFFEALRIIEETQPKVAIAENVKNLVGKKFNAQFQVVLASLEAAGYNNYWKVLNAKDYGIPQNRERVFIVSIRKDIDTGSFKFPEGFPLELRLKDVLEDEVDEKFYLSDKMLKYALNIEKEAKGIGFSDGVDKSYINPEIAQTIGCRSAAHQRSGVTNYVTNKSDQPIRVSDLKNGINMLGLLDIKGNEQVRRVYGTDGIAPTLNTMQGGNRQPKVLIEPSDNDGKILVREATKKGYAEAAEGDAINLEQPNSKTRRRRVGHGVAQTLTTSPQQGVVIPTVKEMIKENNKNAKHQQDLLQHHEDICRCIPAGTHGSTPHLTKTVVSDNPLRIRKLTPKECFRLMGFSDEDFAKAEAVNSNTQLYKQAGNSIVVDVIAHIFTQLKGVAE